MKRVVWAVLAASAALLVGCSSPHIALGQDNAVNVPVGASFAFSGVIQDASGTILWKLDGPGSISSTAGLTTVYTAPSSYNPDANKATLVASLSEAPDEKQTVVITITKPSSSVSGIPGLASSVTVTYDERDIPTISCTKSADCYSVLGFIHARDRLFQMDFFRRAARGRLAELVGDAALDQDEAIRTFFTTRTGQPVPEALYAHSQEDPLVAPRLAAYTNGPTPSSPRSAPILETSGGLRAAPLRHQPREHGRPPGLERRGYRGRGAPVPVQSLRDPGGGGGLRQVGVDLERAAGRYPDGSGSDHRAVDPGEVTHRVLHPGGERSPERAQPRRRAIDDRVAPRDRRDAGSGKPEAGRPPQLRALMGSPAGSNNWVVDGEYTTSVRPSSRTIHT
jgi:hypothetical protein